MLQPVLIGEERGGVPSGDVRVVSGVLAIIVTMVCVLMVTPLDVIGDLVMSMDVAEADPMLCRI